jgi:chromosome segregation ATPase
MQDKTLKMRAYSGKEKSEPAPANLEITQELPVLSASVPDDVPAGENAQPAEEGKALEALKIIEQLRESLKKEQARSAELEAKITLVEAKVTLAEAKATVAEAQSAELAPKLAAAEVQAAELKAKLSAAEAKNKELSGILHKISGIMAEANSAKQEKPEKPANPANPAKPRPPVDINLDHI